jgi:photosystem II stability/assembly factor-like uncharacterized protein
MPILRCSLLLAGLLLAGLAPASAGWLPLGSPVQPIIELRLDPSLPGLLYAGTSAGPGAFFYLWRSADAGATWSNVQAGPAQILQALAIDPEDPRVIWVWTLDNELWRSDDAGATWSLRPTPVESSQDSTHQMLVDPHRPETLYRVKIVDFQLAVAVSRDGGATFTQGAPLTQSFTNLEPVVVDPRSGALLAFVAEGLRASTNGGQSWSLRGQFHNAGFTQGALAPSDSRTLYGIPTNTANQCLVRSDDGGAHWQALAYPPRLPAHSTCDAVAVDPLNAHHVWVTARTVANGHAQHLLFESSNAGARWSNPVAEPAAGVVAAGGERIYTSSFAAPGLFVSANGGRTWTDAGRGIIAGDVREGLVAQRLLGGARRLVVAVNTPQGGPPNDIYRSDGGPSWVKVPIPPEQTIADASGSIVLAGNANGVLRSSDSGITWSAVPSAPPGVLAFLPSVNQPSYTALTAAEDVGPDRSIALWTSDDSGATWHRGDSGLPTACVRVTVLGILACPTYSAYLADPFDPSRRWLAYDFADNGEPHTLFTSTDGGASWQEETSSLPRTLALVGLSMIPKFLLAGTDGGLFESPNNGKEWGPWGDLPAGVVIRQFAWDPLSFSLYAATRAHGIYRSLDDGTHWTLLAGAPDHDDPTIAIDPRRPTALLVAFEGQGLWRWTP